MMSRVLIVLALLVILGVPLGVKLTTTEDRPAGNARKLVVITPHVPQIRREFGEAFSRWHQRVYGEPAVVDWRSPGAGTTEIIKILAAQYTAAAKEGKFDWTDVKNPTAPPGTIAFDMMFGGGSFDHNRLKSEVKLRLPGAEMDVTLPMSVPAGFSQQQVDAWFGDNRVGAELLYDPGQFWLGTALSGFGIVYNRDAFERLGLPSPRGFHDLTSGKLQGELILADPRQSGSVTTAIDSILNAELWSTARREGWESELDAAFRQERATGTPWERTLSASRMPSVEAAFVRAWKTLRDISANARAYTAAATRPPIDVSAGEGAAGLAIDFYGRGQAQAVVREGQDPQTSRVGYVDPEGAAYIDADPASILRGGPEPELSRRFLEFVLSDEGQALWQFASKRTRTLRGQASVRAADGTELGPAFYELRRLPVRRVMYQQYLPEFIDQIDPFAIASGNRPANWRSAIGVMMGAFSIDVLHEQQRAWKALNSARDRAVSGDFDANTLRDMEAAFYAFPTTPGKDGSDLAFTAANFRAIRDTWRPRVPGELEIRYTTFFREQYRMVVSLYKKAS